MCICVHMHVCVCLGVGEGERVSEGGGRKEGRKEGTKIRLNRRVMSAKKRS